MKKLVAIAVASSALAFGALVAPTEPAEAAKPRPCATKSAYKKVHQGQTKKHVKKILRSKGHRNAISTTLVDGQQVTAELRSYKTCKKYGSVTVMFLNGEVLSKAGVFHR